MQHSVIERLYVRWNLGTKHETGRKRVVHLIVCTFSLLERQPLLFSLHRSGRVPVPRRERNIWKKKSAFCNAHDIYTAACLEGHYSNQRKLFMLFRFSVEIECLKKGFQNAVT